MFLFLTLLSFPRVVTGSAARVDPHVATMPAVVWSQRPHRPWLQLKLPSFAALAFRSLYLPLVSLFRRFLSTLVVGADVFVCLVVHGFTSR